VAVRREAEIVGRRLRAQGLTGAGFATPQEAVGSLLAVQAQDYGPAKWSVGMRVAGATDELVEQALATGSLLRTHVLRPTWHFVLPADIRWLLTATAPRIKARDAGRCRQLGLDEETFARSARLLAGALGGGDGLTRAEAGAVLKRGGVDVTGQRLPYLLMHAELDALICSGPRRGVQHTYVLLDERAPCAVDLPREEALARLAVRYFCGHGPATERDLAAWASLTLAEVRRALDAVAGGLVREEVDGTVYWSGHEPTQRDVEGEGPDHEVRLIHTYDEYIMGFAESRRLLTASGVGLPERWTPLVLHDGREAGSWRRTLARDVLVEVDLRRPFDESGIAALEAEAARFGEFLGLSVRLRVGSAGPDVTAGP
jgi:hypothetical protein